VRSPFDGVHLFCEARGIWTNLLDPRFEGRCLLDRDGRPGQPGLCGDDD
jgi:hypothetical protein